MTPYSFWTTVDRFTTACKITSWHYWSKLRLMFRCFSQVTHKTLTINTGLRLVQTGVSLWVARPTNVNNGSNRTLLCWKTTKHGYSGWIYKRTGWCLAPENRYNKNAAFSITLFKMSVFGSERRSEVGERKKRLGKGHFSPSIFFRLHQPKAWLGWHW